jgi:molybdopterin molybdotransferase
MDRLGDRSTNSAGTGRLWDDPDSLISVDEVRERVLAAVQPLPPVRTPLFDALGLVLAEGVVASHDVPPFTNSAMDGYAVRARDTVGASPDSPVTLAVVTEVPAGTRPAVAVGPGQAARIMTGAIVPDGADAIVRFEHTDEWLPLGRRSPQRQRGLIRIFRPAEPGEHVRSAGEDLRAGHEVLRPGTVLCPACIGLLASLNLRWVTVHRRPRVAILATGNEVVDLGPDLMPGQIRNSNNYTLAALVKQAGGEPVLLGVVRDDPDDLRLRLHQARGVDLIVTSGGVSIGDYDLVKYVLQAEGRIELWQVRIKPGKPMAFGWIGGVPMLGLPGNPVAAFVAFFQFGQPMLRKLLGYRDWTPPTVRARLLAPCENRGRRRHFVRVWVERHGEELVARPVGEQGAGILSSLALANGLAVIPEQWPEAPAGALVDVQLLHPTWLP